MNFIVTGMPKTGKTMLCCALNTLENFTVYDEILLTRPRSPKMPAHPDKVIENVRDFIYKNSLYSWYTKKYNTDTENIKNVVKKDDVYEYLNKIFSNKNTGFILHHHHVESLPCVKEYIYENNIKVIHMLRRDRISQAVNIIGNRLFFTGTKFKISKDLIEYTLSDIEQRTEDLRNWFGGIEYYYEDMTGNKVVKEIDVSWLKSFLCVEIPNKINTITKKLMKDNWKDCVLNPEEILKWSQDAEMEKRSLAS